MLLSLAKIVVVISKVCFLLKCALLLMAIACKHGDGVDASVGKLLRSGAIQVVHNIWFNILLRNDIKCRNIHEQRSE